jgi:hypothetical protein
MPVILGSLVGRHGPGEGINPRGEIGTNHAGFDPLPREKSSHHDFIPV